MYTSWSQKKGMERGGQVLLVVLSVFPRQGFDKTKTRYMSEPMQIQQAMVHPKTVEAQREEVTPFWYIKRQLERLHVIWALPAVGRR